MTIEYAVVVKCGDKQLHLFGDRHMYNGEDLTQATDLYNNIVQLIENGAYAFIEFSTYELEHARKDGGNKGLRYKIPVLLDDLNNDLKNNVVLHDCRTSTTAIPLMSWFNVSHKRQLTTKVTWRDCCDVVENTKRRLEMMENLDKSKKSNFLIIARNVFECVYPYWVTIQEQICDSFDETLDKRLRCNEDLVFPVELAHLYEVGLLCDISSVVSAPNFVGIVFCGVEHICNILPRLQEFGWELKK